MNSSHEAAEQGDKNRNRFTRAPYEKPAIIYEGKITIRAGSPFFTGNPFDSFGGPPGPGEG
jgi:hypothetical protein